MTRILRSLWWCFFRVFASQKLDIKEERCILNKNKTPSNENKWYGLNQVEPFQGLSVVKTFRAALIRCLYAAIIFPSLSCLSFKCTHIIFCPSKRKRVCKRLNEDILIVNVVFYTVSEYWMHWTSELWLIFLFNNIFVLLHFCCWLNIAEFKWAICGASQ